MFSFSPRWFSFIVCCAGVIQTDALHVPARYSNKQHVLGNELSAVQGIIKEFMDANSVPALSLAVTKDDRLVYAQAYGLANCTSLAPATPEYLFRVASISKTITAVAIMALAEQGYFNLTSKVLGRHAILDDDFGSKPYSGAERAITVQDLLEHSSGFIDHAMGGDPTYQPQWLSQSHNELVATVLDAYDPAVWPGTNASYSNFGYMILGRIVEKVAGVSYTDFVQEHVLHKLGVRNMHIANDKPRLNEVSYYDSNASAPYTFHISRRDSVGAWLARPVDLVAILTSIDGRPGRDDIIQRKTEKVMYERSKVENSPYAKGWDDVHFDDGGSLVEASKSGGFPGTTAWISVRANESITYAVVINKAMGSGNELKQMVDSIMLTVKDWPNVDMFQDFGID